jgi:hypothetical protein
MENFEAFEEMFNDETPEFGVENIDVDANVSVSKTNDNKSSGEYSITTFWRSNALMSVIEGDNKLLLKFMLGEGKDPKENKYKQDTKTFFSFDRDELFLFVAKLSQAYVEFETKGTFKNILITHKYNDENKTLNVTQGQKNKNTVYVALSKGNDKYYISLDKESFKYFLFTLKIALYKMFVGTRVGFSFDWI